MKIGSLFDGIGGFPLAGSRSGITPVWASEIEPVPVKITEKHFPEMVHLGDITKINGAEIEPVDIITAGSPCQDLSVAGKRAGLEGQRSGLFMDFVRIVREMRNATNNEYPRYILWENVPGAFSSNGGQDFRAVLEEIAETEIPMPEGGKWATAGMVELPDRSLAWRVLDAQFWGVPQRRKRIFLVADFTGGSSGEILFESESLSGYSPEGTGQRKAAAGDVEGGAGTASVVGVDCYNHAMTGDISATLTAASGSAAGHSGPQVMIDLKTYKASEGVALTMRAQQGGEGYGVAFAQNQRDEVRDLGDKSGALQAQPGMKQQTFVACLTPWDCQSKRIFDPEGKHPTLPAMDGGGANNTAVLIPYRKARRAQSTEDHETWVEDDKTNTLNAFDVGDVRTTEVIVLNDQGGESINTETDLSPTLRAQSHGNHPCVALFENHAQDAKINGPVECAPTVTARYGTGGGNTPMVMAHGQANAEVLEGMSPTLNCNHEQPILADQAIVRRLTPLECERLQGFPDGWTEGHSDTQRYKALGNSIAVPCAEWILGRIEDQ